VQQWVTPAARQYISTNNYFAMFFIITHTQTKFGIAPGDEASIRAVVQSYLEGLYWVLTYYHQGCGSWTWFYPYLYAPLASDLVGLGELKAHFEPGRPFTPLMQLLSVLPPQSGTLLFFLCALFFYACHLKE